MPKIDLVKLVNQLVLTDSEEPWLEFKENISDPEKIGRTISALSNGAALSGHENAYFIWGVKDDTHEIVGTDFNMDKAKKGNENLANWLRSALSANVDFHCSSCEIDEKKIQVIIIDRALGNPALFQNVAYIRDGSYVKPLSKILTLEQKLWRQLQAYSFETSLVTDSLIPEKVEELLDCSKMLKLLRLQKPQSRDSLMDILEDNDAVKKQDDGGYCITALGALLFANDITLFDALSRKTIRLIRYGKNSKFTIEKEVEITRGYATGFEETEKYLSLLLPSEEAIEGSERHTVFRYPPVAVRELLANALIHQDLMQTGMNVSLEIFDDKVVISNPGRMLIEPDRVVNATPVSRNERIARIMRIIGLCEELGSGWDRAVEACEEYLLPAPTVRCDDNSTVVTLLNKKTLSSMTADEKSWSCYMHACSQYAQGRYLTNSSLRTRFGVQNTNSGAVTISRIIKNTRDSGLIKPFEEKMALKNAGYIPYWA